MLITRLELQNWKNFEQVDVKLSPRIFIVGDNSTGKSNLMDSLRFLRDIANPRGGGLQTALEKRGGLNRTRSLFARNKPTVRVCVEVTDEKGVNTWKYDIVIGQETSGKRRILVKSEKVLCNNEPVLIRPDKRDNADSERLTQTALEQVGENKDFRELSKFFQSFKYLHTVPQLIRHGSEIQGKTLADDPFGQNLINNIAVAPKKIQDSSLKRIFDIFTKIKPAFQGKEIEFKLDRDDLEILHLMFRYPTWRPHDSWQTEEILSDGELRLIGLLWTVLTSHSLILLEEPELSLNEGIVERLAGLFVDAVESKKKKKDAQQIIMSTHSYALLSDEDITAEEILLLRSEKEKTIVVKGDKFPPVARDMRGGLPASQGVLRFAQSGDFSLRGKR